MCLIQIHVQIFQAPPPDFRPRLLPVIPLLVQSDSKLCVEEESDSGWLLFLSIASLLQTAEPGVRARRKRRP